MALTLRLLGVLRFRVWGLGWFRVLRFRGAFLSVETWKVAASRRKGMGGRYEMAEWKASSACIIRNRQPYMIFPFYSLLSIVTNSSQVMRLMQDLLLSNHPKMQEVVSIQDFANLNQDARTIHGFTGPPRLGSFWAHESGPEKLAVMRGTCEA